VEVEISTGEEVPQVQVHQTQLSLILLNFHIGQLAKSATR
jgi:hypothetical protein